MSSPGYRRGIWPGQIGGRTRRDPTGPPKRSFSLKGRICTLTHSLTSAVERRYSQCVITFVCTKVWKPWMWYEEVVIKSHFRFISLYTVCFSHSFEAFAMNCRNLNLNSRGNDPGFCPDCHTGLEIWYLNKFKLKRRETYPPIIKQYQSISILSSVASFKLKKEKAPSTTLF